MEQAQWEVFSGLLMAGITVHQDIEISNTEEVDPVLGLMVRAGFIFKHEQTRTDQHHRFMYASHNEHHWTCMVRFPKEGAR